MSVGSLTLEDEPEGECMDASMDFGGARDAAGGFPEITMVI